MAYPIRFMPSQKGPRVETGPIQFGDDWPGLFIRGDNAFGIAQSRGRLSILPSKWIIGRSGVRQITPAHNRSKGDDLVHR